MSTIAAIATRFQAPPGSTDSSASLRRISVMRASELFSGFTESQCAPFAALARPQVYARGTLLFAQGDPIRQLTVVLRGCVTLSQTGLQDEQAIVGLAGKGDALRWTEQTSSRVHSCSARVCTTCATLAWDRSLIDVMATNYSRLQYNLNGILFSRLQDLETRFCELTSKSVEKRLALSIARLAPKFGVSESSALRVLLSRTELAKYSGTCIFTASRILSRWMAEGLIATHGREIVVLNENQLRTIAESSV